MATEAIIGFGRRHRALFRGPVLEIGSKIQPGYSQHGPREIHGDDPEWFGIDIETGEGVDLVCDLTAPGGVESLGPNRFSTVHCHCVLEHVPDVFGMARAIEQLLDVGGILFVSVPFAWKIHRIPVDLWRFTPQGIDYLFPRVEFDPAQCAFSSRLAGECHPVEAPPELPLGTALPGKLLGLSIRALRRLGLDQSFFRHRALLVESNLMMIGVRRDVPSYTFMRPVAATARTSGR
jgi:hypothetical protein